MAAVHLCTVHVAWHVSWCGFLHNPPQQLNNFALLVRLELCEDDLFRTVILHSMYTSVRKARCHHLSDTSVTLTSLTILLEVDMCMVTDSRF